MTKQQLDETSTAVTRLEDLATLADYSLMNTLNSDPDATVDGDDYRPRQVFTGHYVPVKPTPIADSDYVAHSKVFFRELHLDDSLAQTDDFRRLFSGDLSHVPAPMRKIGWATGYALSIYGTEYIQQCPFQTGNGYGDGRAVSVLEAVISGQRWEMQLKGGGRTPYCRGGDGRAVLRSSVREFLAQEHMYALGIPTSRSLCLYVSKTESVNRPWYSEGSLSTDPDIMVSEPVAISTRVAPSFLRVGQLELFGRRARKGEHPKAMEELEMIALHLIEREYKDVIDDKLSTAEKVVALAAEFRYRLTSLVANWLRVGYCQGNFNSDNCAGGGFTLDYGPFGFCELFDPSYQPWTGGGQHFSYFNQPAAAERNFHMFWTALRPLLESHPKSREKFDEIRQGFSSEMELKLEMMWAAKLGLNTFNTELFRDLMTLMEQTSVDYTIFFRELSNIPENIEPLKKSFYNDATDSLEEHWSQWLEKWKSHVCPYQNIEERSKQMKQVNPKYIWREWLVAPAYQLAMGNDYTLVRELQEVLSQPFDEQSKEVEDKYYRLRPQAFFKAGGVSHYSCSS
ncbi:protein adenylyltransferase SelO family protein [Simiduia litorea]|uniref:protein adenylyltransferase SelO n=1 Tax=Simiduia litorea TaxID=1435348 RepID=UPI0036F2188A